MKKKCLVLLMLVALVAVAAAGCSNSAKAPLLKSRDIVFDKRIEKDLEVDFELFGGQFTDVYQGDRVLTSNEYNNNGNSLRFYCEYLTQFDTGATVKFVVKTTGGEVEFSILIVDTPHPDSPEVEKDEYEFDLYDSADIVVKTDMKNEFLARVEVDGEATTDYHFEYDTLTLKKSLFQARSAGERVEVKLQNSYGEKVFAVRILDQTPAFMQVKVSGRLNFEGAPVQGVSAVCGSDNAVVTDADGKYELTLSVLEAPYLIRFEGFPYTAQQIDISRAAVKSSQGTILKDLNMLKGTLTYEITAYDTFGQLLYGVGINSGDEQKTTDFYGKATFSAVALDKDLIFQCTKADYKTAEISCLAADADDFIVKKEVILHVREVLSFAGEGADSDRFYAKTSRKGGTACFTLMTSKNFTGNEFVRLFFYNGGYNGANQDSENRISEITLFADPSQSSGDAAFVQEYAGAKRYEIRLKEADYNFEKGSWIRFTLKEGVLNGGTPTYYGSGEDLNIYSPVSGQSSGNGGDYLDPNSFMGLKSDGVYYTPVVSIRGVVWTTDSPLAGAKVTLQEHVVTTDENGVFTFANLKRPFGSINFSIEKAGYRTAGGSGTYELDNHSTAILKPSSNDEKFVLSVQMLEFTGTVSDLNGTGLSGYTVRIGDKTSVTAADGSYSIPGVACNEAFSVTVDNTEYTKAFTPEDFNGSDRTRNLFIQIMQGDIAVHVYVKDASNSDVLNPDYTVINNLTGETVTSGQGEGNGYITFDMVLQDIPAEGYTLTVMKSGYTEQSVTIHKADITQSGLTLETIIMTRI